MIKLSKHLRKFRNDITVCDNLVYLNDKLITPVKPKIYILELLHETHMGLNNSIKRARSHY